MTSEKRAVCRSREDSATAERPLGMRRAGPISDDVYDLVLKQPSASDRDAQWSDCDAHGASRNQTDCW